MFDKAKSTLASLFGQLAEIQKDIDDSARKVVEGLVRLIDIVDDEAASSHEALAGRDFSWYEEVTRALMNEGFTSPVAFEPRAWMSRPVESRIIVDYALGGGGAIVACWFAMPATATRPERGTVTLFTLFEDGNSLDTIAGGAASNLPLLDTEREERLPEGTPVPQLLAQHRARVAAHGSAPRRFDFVGDYHALRQERAQQRTAFRQGLGLSLVAQYIEARFTGDRAEVGRAYLDAIRKHPEWYKYANGNAETAAPSGFNSANTQREAGEGAQNQRVAGEETANGVSSAPAASPMMPLNFLVSPTEDGRRTLSTFGMLFSGLPELLMTEVAANHCRAARVLAGTVASGIARHRDAHGNDAEFLAQIVSESGARIALTRADAIAARVTQLGGGSPLPVDVHLALRGFTSDDEPSMLLVNPLPDESHSFDERLREACARLGVDVPVARDAATGNDALREAHEHAVLRLDEVRARWNNRAATEETVLVKFRATHGEIGEYVWLEVREWQDGTLSGEIVTAAPRVGLPLGQLITIELSQVYDQLVIGLSGAAMPALTDMVATDYGMDV